MPTKNGLPFPLRTRFNSTEVDPLSKQVVEPDISLHPRGDEHENPLTVDESIISDEIKNHLDQSLKMFVNKYPDIQNIILTTVDGFEVSAVLEENQKDSLRRVAAMSSSLQSIGSAMLQEIGVPNYQYLYLNSSKRSVFIYLISGKSMQLVLMAISGEIDSLGQALWLINKLSDDIKSYI
ncbi:roadblock/LC7 domain-containing protein [Salmonella enterica]|nr:roadblock/LC7 domain-containing protein [Salmonella enterica]